MNGNTFKKNIIAACAFFILLIPKAGINIGVVPITLSTFLVIAMIFCTLDRNIWLKSPYFLIYGMLAGTWILICFYRSDLLVAYTDLRFGTLMWFVFTPVFWLVINYGISKGLAISARNVIFPFGITVLFGIGQLLNGLNFLQIKGITLAVGASYQNKNLGVITSSDSVTSKIPSTYQGGNIWGQCAALILVWIIAEKIYEKYSSKLIKLIVIAMPVVAISISLSRTALIAALFGLIAHFRKSLIKILFYSISTILIVTFIVPTLNPVANQRYSFESFLQAGGRGAQWQSGLSSFTFSDWLFGGDNVIGNSTFRMEGLLGMVAQIGLIGVLILFLSAKKCSFFKVNAVTISLLTCIILDSTYVSPPILWIPPILALASKKFSSSYS
jgi:hypothetical protein